MRNHGRQLEGGGFACGGCDMCFAAIPAKERGKAFLFLGCAKATLLLAPKGGEPRSPPLESPIATCSAGIAVCFDKLHEVLLKMPR